MEVNLSEVQIGDAAIIVSVDDSHDDYRQRLLSLGLVPGADFIIERVAPLGDPIEVILNNGEQVTVRKHEAAIIKVIKVDA